MLRHFTRTSFSVRNAIYLVFLVLVSPLLGFRLLGEYKYRTTAKPLVSQSFHQVSVSKVYSSIHPSRDLRIFSYKKDKNGER